MSRQWIKTGSFRARSGLGDEVTVIEETSYTSLPAFGGWAQVEGMKRLKTTDGRHVNFTGTDQYAFPDGTPLTRI